MIDPRGRVVFALFALSAIGAAWCIGSAFLVAAFSFAPASEVSTLPLIGWLVQSRPTSYILLSLLAVICCFVGALTSRKAILAMREEESGISD